MVKNHPSKNLQVFLFNVGHGDHILIRFPDGKYGVIDFHYALNLNMTEPPALTYFKMQYDAGIKPHLAFICFSHADMDHLHGSEKLLEWIEINDIKVDDLLLFGGNDFDVIIDMFKDILQKYLLTLKDDIADECWVRFFEYANRLDVINKFRVKWKKKTNNVVKYVNNIQIDLLAKKHFRIDSLAPLGEQIFDYDTSNISQIFKKLLEGLYPLQSDKKASKKKIKSSVKRNNISSVLLLKFEKYKLIFGGDAEIETWNECLKELKDKELDCEANFIKASHHGSSGSSSIELWNEITSSVSPVHIGISAGKNFPDLETLLHIKKVKNNKDIEVNVDRTNICSWCIPDLKYQKFDSSWFTKAKKPMKLPKKVEETIVEDLANGDHAEEKANLLAYVYEFKEGAKFKIDARKALSPEIFGYEKCQGKENIRDYVSCKYKSKTKNE